MGDRWKAVVCALCAGIACAPLLCGSTAHAQDAMARLGVGEIVERSVPQDSARPPAQSSVGERRISIELRDVPLKEALKVIAVRGAVVLFYNDRDIPTQRRVSVALKNVTVSDAIRRVLRGTGMRTRVSDAGIVIEPRPPADSSDAASDTTGAIVGSVVDSASGDGIEGATITVRGQGRSAASDASGRFRIAGVSAGQHTVVARRLGYRQVVRDVVVQSGEDVRVRIDLVPAPRRLDQIVTTATGEQARKEVGNLLATIQADSVMATAPVTSIAQLLAGRAAGVQVYFGSGLTGASLPINIRGQNSLSLSNQPLLVVDGVRVDNSTAGMTTPPTYAGASSGRFDDLDPMQIDSIEIVKGPSAATLYGTDAANGVIIVKTKRGHSGPPSWSAFAEGGVLTFDRKRFPTSYFPWGHPLTGSPTPGRCTLLAVAAGSCSQDSVTNFSPLRDLETTPIGIGNRYRVGLQLRGGGAVRYFMSATLENETGYIKMPNADRALLEMQAGRDLTSAELHPNAASRYGVRGNFSVPIASSLDIDFNAALNRADIRIPDPGAILYGGVSTGTRDLNDGWTLGLRAGDYLIKRDREDVTHFTGGVTLRWHPNSWLSGRLTAGLDLSSDYVDRLVPAGMGFSASTLRGARENTKVISGFHTIDAGLSASIPLGSSVTSRSSIGVQYNRRSVLSNTAAARDLVPGAATVSGGAVPMVGESTVESVVGGAYLEETAGWKDRLFLTGAVRVDGASSFGSGFHSAIYPKASVSWLLSEEPFWPHLPSISSLRLRAAYGESGVQPGPVAALPAETLFPVVTTTGAATGARLGALGNRGLRPERQREFEGGLDVELLAGRIGLQATFYDKRSSDALVSVSLPSSLGGGSQWQNVGAVRNRGYEGTLHARLLAMPRISWSLSLSGSLNDNTVLAIAPGLDAIYNTGTILPSLVSGYPLKSYFDYPIESIADADGDGIIVPSEVVVGDEPSFAGGGYPRTQISASTTVGLFGERLILSGLVEHRGGYVIANISESLRCVFGACRGTAFQGADLADQAANVARGSESLHKTYWGYYEEGAFTRLRELSLTYNLSPSAAAMLRARSASITLSGRNLALWTSYSGTDPEIQSQPGNEDFPVTFDRVGIPAPTYWLLRVNLEF